MKFIDSTEIFVASGKGGNGLVSFKTARNMPRLGPDGGDGGHGGDVVFVAAPQLNTLSTVRYKSRFVAENGVKGGTSGCLLYTSPSPRDRQKSRMPSSA